MGSRTDDDVHVQIGCLLSGGLHHAAKGCAHRCQAAPVSCGLKRVTGACASTSKRARSATVLTILPGCCELLIEASMPDCGSDIRSRPESGRFRSMAASPDTTNETGSSEYASADDGSAAAAPGAVSSSDKPAEPTTSESTAADEGRIQQAEECKSRGNGCYASGDYMEATKHYWEAVDTCPESATKQRAVYLGNLAACHLKLEQWVDAREQSSAALRADPSYIKALMRRAIACEKLDNLDQALADAKQVQQLDKESTWARQQVARLEPLVQERQERLKEEMLGKLKDLGNNLLGKFGLSLDNFKAEQDPGTGSYSIKFQQ